MTQIFYVGQSIIASIRGLNSRFFYNLSFCFYCFPSLAAGMMKVFLAHETLLCTTGSQCSTDSITNKALRI
jgi:hypothetical protein